MSEVRLRRHTDGRVALSLWPGQWKIIVWRYSTTALGWLPDSEVSTPGWVELFVAELPEPDSWADVVGDDGQFLNRCLNTFNPTRNPPVVAAPRRGGRVRGCSSPRPSPSPDPPQMPLRPPHKPRHCPDLTQ